MDSINLNDLIGDIKQLIELKERLSTADQKFDRQAAYDLSAEILEDLEESSKKELAANMQRFNRERLKYDGGQWTKGGAVNDVFINDLKKYNVDNLQFINNRYKDAEGIKTATSVSTEIYQALQALNEENGFNNERILQTMQITRRLVVFSFACTKAMGNEIRHIATNAPELPNNITYLEFEDVND